MKSFRDFAPNRTWLISGAFLLVIVAGFALSQLRLHRPDLVDAGARELLDHMLAGRLRPVVHSRLPLVEAAKSHELLESRAQTGKIVLIP